jgi:MFS family permease
MLATFYFLTIHMQVGKGFSPMLTGLAFLPFAIGIGVAAGWIGPALLSRTDGRAVMVTGLLTAAAAMGWLSLMTADTSPWLVLLPAQGVAGVGLGLVIVTTTLAGVAGVDAAESGVAAALVNTATQIGGALGLAVLVGIATAAGTGSAGFIAAAALYLLAAGVAVRAAISPTSGSAARGGRCRRSARARSRRRSPRRAPGTDARSPATGP